MPALDLKLKGGSPVDFRYKKTPIETEIWSEENARVSDRAIVWALFCEVYVAKKASAKARPLGNAQKKNFYLLTIYFYNEIDYN